MARGTVLRGDRHMGVLLPGLGLSGTPAVPTSLECGAFLEVAVFFPLPASLPLSVWPLPRGCVLPRPLACLVSSTSRELCGPGHTGQWSVRKGLPFVPGTWPAQGLTPLPDGGSTDAGAEQAAPRPVGLWLGTTFACCSLGLQGLKGTQLCPKPHPARWVSTRQGMLWCSGMRETGRGSQHCAFLKEARSAWAPGSAAVLLDYVTSWSPHLHVLTCRRADHGLLCCSVTSEFLLLPVSYHCHPNKL